MNRRESFKAFSLGVVGLASVKFFGSHDKPVSKLRKCEVRSNGTWIETDFENIKKGNMFRLFEPDGTLVVDPGQKNNGRHIALSNPEEVMVKGTKTWSVESIPYENLDKYLAKEEVVT